jgi:hypothetical protein
VSLRQRVLVVLLLGAASGVTAATPATAALARAAAAPSCPGLGIGLVEIPAGTADPRATQYVIDHVAPGARFSRRFQVCNGSAKSVTVAIYAGAAHIAGGSFQIDAGHAVNELTRWIRVEPAAVTIAPGKRVIASASFAVPRNAEQGERYAVLLAELPAHQAGSGVNVASRVGVRVYLDVGPGGAPKSDFAVDSLQAVRTPDGKGQVTAAVHNTGKRALDFTGSLSLNDGPGGLSGGPYPARLGTTLAPGDAEPVVVPIDAAVADGPWTADLTLKSGLLVRKVRGVIRFPAAPGAAAPVDVEQLPVAGDEVVHPERTLLAVAIPVLAVAGLIAWRRRRSRSG